MVVGNDRVVSYGLRRRISSNVGGSIKIPVNRLWRDVHRVRRIVGIPARGQVVRYDRCITFPCSAWRLILVDVVDGFVTINRPVWRCADRNNRFVIHRSDIKRHPRHRGGTVRRRDLVVKPRHTAEIGFQLEFHIAVRVEHAALQMAAIGHSREAQVRILPGFAVPGVIGQQAGCINHLCLVALRIRVPGAVHPVFKQRRISSTNGFPRRSQGEAFVHCLLAVHLRDLDQAAAIGSLHLNARPHRRVAHPLLFGLQLHGLHTCIRNLPRGHTGSAQTAIKLIAVVRIVNRRDARLRQASEFLDPVALVLRQHAAGAAGIDHV